MATNVNALSWLAPPVITLEDSAFTSAQLTTITHPDPQAIIHYTLDGSDPDETSTIYSTAITIDHTQSLKAKAFKPTYAPSQIDTKSYLFDQSSTLPVLMITTAPDNLWDDETGIYTEVPTERYKAFVVIVFQQISGKTGNDLHISPYLRHLEKPLFL